MNPKPMRRKFPHLTWVNNGGRYTFTCATCGVSESVQLIPLRVATSRERAFIAVHKGCIIAPRCVNERQKQRMKGTGT